MAQSAPHPLIAKIQAWAASHPMLVLALLRTFKPVLLKDKFALVTRYDDVQDLMTRDDFFNVTYQARMEEVTGGQNFFLGMQDTPQYTRDASLMRLAMRREDVPIRVAEFAEREAERIMQAAPGKIDVIAELTKVVPTLWVGDYFGTPGRDRGQMTEAASLMFAYLFFPPDAAADKIALQAARTTCEYLDQTIAARKAERTGRKARMQAGGARDGAAEGGSAASTRDDVLERLLQMQDSGMPGTDDLAIRNNIIGMLIGAIPTTSKCAVLCLDYLLSHPALLGGAQAAARADDDKLVHQYVLESIRFNSFGPGLFRLCVQDFVVGAGSWRATKIPAGTTVLVSLQSAMLDGRKIRNPGEFHLDRPSDNYMHWGYGMHTCSGQYVNAVQIAKIVKAVLKRKNLRRAAGAAGQVQNEGVFPAHWTLEFDR